MSNQIFIQSNSVFIYILISLGLLAYCVCMMLYSKLQLKELLKEAYSLSKVEAQTYYREHFKIWLVIGISMCYPVYASIKQYFIYWG